MEKIEVDFQFRERSAFESDEAVHNSHYEGI